MLQSCTDHIHHRFVILPLFSSLLNHSLLSLHRGVVLSASVLQWGSKCKAVSVAQAVDAAHTWKRTIRGQKILVSASAVLLRPASLRAPLHYVSVSHGWWCLKDYSGFGLISHLIGI